ncbi:MAG TPA: hypothetical protein VMZ03_13025 [Chitinophagaceae bacterium]|nr:hypothetical protein [Chitinophagaceae bacterium]
MKTNSTIELINKCITDTGQAMVYRELDDHSKQPLGIKRSIKVDDKGQLYFTMDTQFEEIFADDFFPVEVFFYKKGTPYCASAKGMAEKLWATRENNVCVTMSSVELFGKEKEQKSFLKNLLDNTAKFMGIF